MSAGAMASASGLINSRDCSVKSTLSTLTTLGVGATIVSGISCFSH